jgi:hypothetical protein
VIVPDWLGHLQVDSRGIPVPWVNRWGVEDVDRLQIAYDPHVRRLAVFERDADGAVPDFTRQHMGRQREAMIVGLCQVCGRSVPWAGRLLVASVGTESLVDFGATLGPRLVIGEPWLDHRCAEFALTRCPALIRRRRDEQIRVLAATDETAIAYDMTVGSVDGPLERLSREVLPALWVRLLVDPALPGSEIVVGAAGRGRHRPPPAGPSG